jgi:uncharacterized protein YfaS (alpha-2-macroglobulin family)
MVHEVHHPATAEEWPDATIAEKIFSRKKILAARLQPLEYFQLPNPHIMVPLFRPAVALTAGLFLFASCGSDKLSVVSGSWKDGDIKTQQNVSFVFNKRLLPDSSLYVYDATSKPPLIIEPQVAGYWRMSSGYEAVFSPSQGFLPGTKYTARINPALLSDSNVKQKGSAPAPVTFSTEPLRMSSASLGWTRGSGTYPVLLLKMDFNYPVTGYFATKSVQLRSGGRQLTHQPVSDYSNTELGLQFAAPKSHAEGEEVEVRLKKGISAAGALAPASDTTFTLRIPSLKKLELSDAKGTHTGTSGIISVNTSQPVREEDVRAHLSLEPSVPYTLSMHETGFNLTSDSIGIGQEVQVSLGSGLMGAFGGKLQEPFVETVSFGSLEPQVAFEDPRGMYLSSRGFRNVGLRIVAVPEVEVSVVKVYENNLTRLLRQGSDYDYDSEGEFGGQYEYYDTEELGDTVYKQSFKTVKLPARNATRLLHLDFADRLRDRAGVYIVRVASKDHAWVQQSRVISLSDIGLIVKESGDKVHVFASSIRSARPMGGVQIALISKHNQRIGTATTGGDGVAVIAKDQRLPGGFQPALVTARSGGETSFLWMAGSRVETSRFDVGGRTPNAARLNAMLYSARDLYRPGEEIPVAAIVRTESGAVPPGAPMKLKLVMPSGKDLRVQRVVPNREGMLAAIFSTPRSAQTGTYTAELYTGSDVLIASQAISVEEFLPDRMKVAVSVAKEKYVVGEEVQARIQADNLYGTPAAGRNWEATMTLAPVTFRPKAFADYDFALEDVGTPGEVVRNGVTTDAGAVELAFPLSSEQQGTGAFRGTVTASVFDETGRPVHRYAHFDAVTQPVFVGMKRADDYVQTRRPFIIDLAAVTKDSAATSAEATIRIFKTSYHSVLEQNGSAFTYRSEKQRNLVEEKTVSIGPRGARHAYTPAASGAFEVEVSIPQSRHAVKHSFYAWGYGDTEYTSFEVSREGHVDIAADKPAYKVGEAMKLLFTTPLEGRIIVTVEREGMLSHHSLETRARTASLTLPASEAAAPNVYIGATLIRPMDASDLPLTVAYGYLPITVEAPRTRLPLTVTLAPKSRSKTVQTVTVKTSPGAFVTVAAVDEGILQVKSFKTPDPYAHYHQKMALGLQSYNIYPLLLPEVAGGAVSSTGGDYGGGEDGMRVNPTFVNQPRLLSHWSGIRQADGRGVLRYDIEVPQFSGDIRVMAVAVKGRQFAGADQHMIVADPLVVTAGLPRALSPGDEVRVPVTIANTTTSEATAQISVTASGPVRLTGTAQTLRIPAGREGRVVYSLKALAGIGPGAIRVSVSGLGETFIWEGETSVRPPIPIQRVQGTGTVLAGNAASIQPPSPFIPATAQGHIIVSRSPLVQYAGNLRYLVQYPYGCVEQTVAAAFPQIYYNDLVRAVAPSSDSGMRPVANVQAAIYRLQSMQLQEGGLSYWPGTEEESWWGSVFAAHFLLEARAAGYDVSQGALDRLLGYLKEKLRTRPTEVHYFTGLGGRMSAPKEIAYSLYVLAKAGDPQLSTMNYYKAANHLLDADGKYLLAAAYVIGRTGTAPRTVIPASLTVPQSNQVLDGSFYSYTRDLGVALNALVDADPSHPQVGPMARQLSAQLLRSSDLNTSENLFGILALGKIARGAGGPAQAMFMRGGTQVGRTAGEAIRIPMNAASPQPLTLSVSSGTFYYHWEWTGLPPDMKLPQEDKNLLIRRTYLDRNGRPLDLRGVKQGELVVVRLTLQSPGGRIVPNVAVTDVLPAGFEIENPRLQDLPGGAWMKQSLYPDYVDYRDDRLHLFADAEKESREYFYSVRAVSPGLFSLSPVQAEAMYSSAFRSVSGGTGGVKILER